MNDEDRNRDALEGVMLDGLQAVRTEPSHELPIVWREAVWAAMGPRRQHSHPWSDEGHRRRALLAIRTVRRVLPLWEQHWPAKPLPHRALADAERALDDPRCAEAYERFKVGRGSRVDRYWFLFRSWSRKSPVDQMIGFAATCALGVSLYDEPFDQEETEPEPEPMEIEDIDAAAWAAMAEAGGEVWNPAADPAKRLAFWEWYLTEAVPAAYRDGSLPPRSEGDS